VQPMTGAPRDALSDAEVEALLQAEVIEVTAGLELLDVNDQIIASEGDNGDISDDLVGGSVSHNNFAEIHGACRLTLRREIEWGHQRLRPYMTIAADGVEARFNLGVYLPDTPDRTIDDSGELEFEVEGYDKLVVLSTEVGATYRVAAGTPVVSAMRTAIEAAGETRHLIDGTSTAVLAQDMVWPIKDAPTWLRVVNDLAHYIGYVAVWADWDGWLRSQPYVAPADRGTEWDYDADDSETIVGAVRRIEADYFNAPNKWVGYVDDPLNGSPTEGDGMYTVVNESTGATSVVGRGGRVIPRTIALDAVDQTALEAQVDEIVAIETPVDRKLHLTTGPNPLHAHADVVSYVDTNAGLDGAFVSEEWELPLDGSPMTHRLREVA